MGDYIVSGVHHGYLLIGGAFTTIDFPGADTTSTRVCGFQGGTYLSGINLFGDIVGRYSAGGDTHGFLLSRGSFTTIDVPPGATCTHAMGISTAGDIVGWYIGADTNHHGFLLSGGSFTTIDVPGYPDAGAFGIDPSSTFVVGLDSPSAADINGVLEHGFLLSGGIFTAIDFPFAGVAVTEALGVNPQGDIVGDYDDSSGATHGFLFGKQKKK